VIGDAAGNCSVKEVCEDSSKNVWNPSHQLWQNHNNTRNGSDSLPDTAITTTKLDVLFTSLDLNNRINESHVLQALGKYVTSEGLLTPADFEMRVTDANVSFYLPSFIAPWAPPTLLPGDCSNLITFNAYFVGSNRTIIRYIKSLFDDGLSSTEGESMM